MLSVIDMYGIELVHPMHKGHSPQQNGRKDKSNTRWIVGARLCLLQNHLGLIVHWDCDTANVNDGSASQHIVESVLDDMVISANTNFIKKDWHPANTGMFHVTTAEFSL